MKKNRKIIVNTAALRSSGALSIYNQFISHLPDYVSGNSYYIFVDSSVNQPVIDGVTYIQDNDHSWIHRILWEHGGLNKWLKKNNINPDVIVSLQNTGVVTDCRQVIYYHQSIPFYNRKWNFFKKEERILWLYKHLYIYFVKSTLNKKTEVVVQIPFIKKGFIRKFHFDPQRIHVLFPDLEKIEIDRISPKDWNKDMIHFLYPATPFPYKEHRTLFEALNVLRELNQNVFDKIRLHLTVSIDESWYIEQLISKYNLHKQIVLEGRVAHSELLSFYKSARGLLFPSTIETLGLPLIEAAVFGLPIIAADMDYAHEVASGYSGVTFVESTDYYAWGKAIESVCLYPQHFDALPTKESSWGSFFKLIIGN